MEEIDSVDMQAVGMRWVSEKTQEAQDRVFKNYLKFLELIKVIKSENDLSDSQKESIAFPNDFNRLYSQTRK